MNTTAEDDESKRTPTPGAKKESTSPKQFTSFLQDGSVLAKLANKLQPGSIETVHEGDDVKDKEKQTDNINNFISFLKDKVAHLICNVTNLLLLFSMCYVFEISVGLF